MNERTSTGVKQQAFSFQVHAEVIGYAVTWSVVLKVLAAVT